MNTTDDFSQLIRQIRRCTICQAQFTHTPRPIVQLNPNAKVLLIGQAPGKLAHDHGLPFSDPSGERLRLWLGIGETEFYDENCLAIMPMAFCFPGKQASGSGDKAPPKICAKTWHQTILSHLPNVELTLLVGRYAAQYYLEEFSDLTSLVATQSIEENKVLLLPHPSPRNNIWLKKNNWFERKTLPKIRQRLKNLLGK